MATGKKKAKSKPARHHRSTSEKYTQEAVSVRTPIEKSGDFYYNLYKLSPVGHFVFDENGLIMDVNFTGATLLGKPKNSLIKQPFTSFVCKDHQNIFNLHLKKTAKTNTCQICRIRLIRKGGTEFFARLKTAALKNMQGNCISFISVIGDITARKKAEEKLRDSEEKYRELVETANSIIMRRAVDGNITFFNEFAQKFFGYTEEEILGRNVVGTIVPASDSLGHNLADMIDNIAKTPELYQNNENENMRKNGERVWVAWTNKPIKDKDGNIVEMLCVGNDITKRKEAEVELDKLNKKLKYQAGQLRKLCKELTETEHRERQRLARILHDDLQQLMAAAKLKVAVLRHKIKDTDLLRSLGDIDEVLKQSIDISRSLAVELSPLLTHKGGLMPALKWLCEHMHKKFGLNVNVEANGEAESVDDECRIVLFEAVRELIFNVVKHAGTKTADVRVKCSDQEFNIEVKDKGAGFDPTHYQSGTDFPEGSGLLNIRERLSLLGGRIGIDSAPNAGTCITLSAPLCKTVQLKKMAKTSVAAKTQPFQRPLPFSASSLPVEKTKKIRVLLADDHEIVRAGLTSLLKHENDIDVVAQASNGQMALDMVKRYKPDIVIMDVSMPVINGLDATRQIADEFPDIKVIGLSMHEDEAHSNGNETGWRSGVYSQI